MADSAIQWPSEGKTFWNPVSARNSFDGIEAGKENKAFEKETENQTAAL